MTNPDNKYNPDDNFEYFYDKYSHEIDEDVEDGDNDENVCLSFGDFLGVTSLPVRTVGNEDIWNLFFVIGLLK